MTMKEILAFDNVRLTYHTRQGEVTALKELTFSLGEGEFAAMIGPSGCGKSTILSLAAGLIKPSAGSVTLGGSIGYMLQRDELFPWRTIEKNLYLPLEVQRKNTPERRARAAELARTYGLADFLKSYPSQLSGGMRQRAALIRTLVMEPDILLLDEPFSALDYQTRLRVSDDIGQIIRREKKTAILVTHDLSEAVSLADRVIILSPRPATIRQTLPLIFDLENDTPLNRRAAPEFKTYFNLIWKELNSNE